MSLSITHSQHSTANVLLANLDIPSGSASQSFLCIVFILVLGGPLMRRL